MSKLAIRKAIELAGTQTALVEKMRPYLPDHLREGFRQGHISNWLNRRDLKHPVPPSEYVPALVAAVDWRMTPADFRPDWWVDAPQDDAA